MSSSNLKSLCSKRVLTRETFIGRVRVKGVGGNISVSLGSFLRGKISYVACVVIFVEKSLCTVQTIASGLSSALFCGSFLHSLI